MYCFTFILKVTKNTSQDTDWFNILMKTSKGSQTLKYFIVIKEPDNWQISSNSMIHVNFNKLDATTPHCAVNQAQMYQTRLCLT